jgi:hypothetical protein
VLGERLREIVLSVYLYNEWRGYTQLEADLIPELERDSGFDADFIAGVRKHAADEKKHYRMFQGWFAARGRMPFAVGPSVGYFGTLSGILVGKRHSASQLVSSSDRFARLCRAVVTTEKRGIHQLDTLLRWRGVREDSRLRRVLEVIRQDEPSHYEPYERWLDRNGYRGPSLPEKLVDWVVHYSIALFFIPALYLNPRLKRLAVYP